MRSDHVRWTGAGCALLAAVLTVLVVTGWEPVVSYDEQLARDLHASAVSHPGVTDLTRVLTDWVWDPWTMRALAALACFWSWQRGRGRAALRVAVAVLVASGVQQGLKALVDRERPVWSDPLDSAQYAAYPSGHAMTATVVCGLLLWLLPRSAPGTAGNLLARTAWAVAAVTVLGVGFTRLYLGVHWFSDVVAGWLLGVALVALAICLPDPGRRVRPASGCVPEPADRR
ncbi:MULTISPECIES: phosphatase PAP2 family protein [unclassified Streptomyces]|uniref:phosphatase PAP2 family protein n=1 Tax=unclassified Streptomyces TaxID=2593676 RepID=UPI00225ABA38|nr:MULTISPECIES: phosphatase PAP2 family protein [unclassified Streptomyces]MCX4524534.1 phosphatase PAP2 family protein [Streptomyces sp. NBC_01551]MCX4544942.1 phosphatase PAP2 family protein [Streptomyces sp. NBC_01565]